MLSRYYFSISWIVKTLYSYYDLTGIVPIYDLTLLTVAMVFNKRFGLCLS